jgi:GT2 family glycosyltransferase
VVCAFTEARFQPLADAVGALRRQTLLPLEVIVCIDHHDALLERARKAFAGARVIPSEEQPGLSGARNTGIRHARGNVIAFLDDDAWPEPTWLAELAAVFADSRVIGAGGVAVPVWQQRTPRWLPPELYWVIGCSYVGLPAGMAEIRNPIGANMAFRRSALTDAGGFVDGIGRVGSVPLGCEETELAIRLRSRTGGVIVHAPAARVHHRVDPSRATWRYLISRCWAEGLSKALVARHTGTAAALASERRYALRTLPRGVIAGIGSAIGGDLHGLLRALAIPAALATTTAGYLRGRLA